MGTKYVTYYRVSTEKQEKSGLGLQAQQRAVEALLDRRKGEVVRTYEEVETGTNKRERPKLQQAIQYCRATGATLVIAKLDRLARNVHFITGLLESGVKFVAADDPDLDMERNPEYVQLKAVIAEREARAISQRTKEALAEARENGVVLGNAQPGKVEALIERHGEDFFTRVGHKGGERAGQVHRRNFEDHYGAIVPIVRKLLAKDRTYQEICDHLNEEGYCTSKGNGFTIPTLARVVRRYQLRDEDHDYRSKPRKPRKAGNPS